MTPKPLERVEITTPEDRAKGWRRYRYPGGGVVTEVLVSFPPGTVVMESVCHAGNELAEALDAPDHVVGGTP